MSVGRLQIAWLSTIFATLLPFLVIAANDKDSLSSETETPRAEDNVSSAEKSILRQISPIPSFQSLTVAGQKIDATYIEETIGDRHGAIVLLHDQGEQIDSSGVVTTLRHYLPDYGWSTLTLSLDFPFEPEILLSTSLETTKDESSEDLTKQATPESLPPISNRQRIEAALAFLAAKDIKQIVFIAHGKGGVIAVDIINTIAVPIFGLIMIGTSALPTNDQFKNMGQPILDLYGDRDLASVSMAVKDRKAEMKREANTNYSERKIDGADHDFDGLQLILTSTIRGWLKTSFLEYE